MRILHIDETFHPAFGYQCNPLAKFQQKAGNEVWILAPTKDYLYVVYRSFGDHGEKLDEQDAAYTASSGVKIVRVDAKGWIMGRLNYKMDELLAAIDRIQPDAIMVHCVETLTATRLLHRLQKRYPMVFDSHMLAMASKRKLKGAFEKYYRLRHTSLIKRKNYTVIKTQNDDYVTSHLGIPEAQTRFISFGTDTLLFCPDPDAKAKFLAENGLPEDTFVICSTGKMNLQKNGKLFAETMRERFANRPVAVVIVAAFQNEYELQVKEILDSSENHIFYYPVQNYLDLPWFYQIADVTVFAKQCSMSFYDAESCGCPVISEKGHVNEERNSHGNGYNFDCGSVEDFRRQIQKMIDLPPAEYQAMRENSYRFVTENYSYEQIAAQVTEELENAYRAFHSEDKNGKRASQKQNKG